MDRKLHALVKLNVVTDVVRIDVQGSLNQESRPSLVHIIRRVRSMGISSHIRVDLSGAAFIESAALAGLRNDLNAIDGETFTGLDGEGVSLQLTAAARGGAASAGIMERSLAITDLLAGGFTDGPSVADSPGQGLLEGRALADYSDDELLAASDSLFAMLDTPEAFAGSDLLARYNDVGHEISRRQPEGGVFQPEAGEEAVS
ncbi:hypothetical protein J7E83_03285 [Arthrobacter sp. ISL-48]|uniref:hypothetical protein n=1 Tax=Arthrobacter sp. ISL-48 TaxID=2819110 RepID=UPI001BEBC873|nr:hypothetical protein [Arthrobacter sp. ISL-48]MBT2531162.1 hypothetical protein [Arthrobacter sp. ISL-48]